MSNFLRWYQYIISAISLQAVAWATIALLRNLLTPALNPLKDSVSYATETMAVQLAIIIIALPLFLIHWLWAERSAETENESDLIRPLYLFFMLTAFLVPIITNSHGFVTSTLRLLFGENLLIPSYSSQLPDQANLIYTGVAVLILPLFWIYNHRLAKISYANGVYQAPVKPIRRFYIYLFSAVGLAMCSAGAATILRWLLTHIPQETFGSGNRVIIPLLALLIVGLPLWLIFWHAAQALFKESTDEQSSLLRKFYLYLIIFLAVMTFVSACTIFLAGIIRQLLKLDPQEGGAVVFSILIVATFVWIYHALVLREDTHILPEGERQASLRRLYWYLISGVGLLALLIGIAGDISLLIGSSGNLVVSSDRQLLANYSAAVIAGIIVWLMPWISLQKELNKPQPQGLIARQDPVRKLYLYFFLLLATLTFLSSMVFILAQLLNALLSSGPNSIWSNELSLAVAYALLAIGIWVYHGYLLNRDRQAIEQSRSMAAGTMRILVIHSQGDELSHDLLFQLQSDIPGIDLNSIFLDRGISDEAAIGSNSLNPRELIAQADLIIGSWIIVSPFLGTQIDDLTQAIVTSPARKLLIPQPHYGYSWSGVEPYDNENAVQQVVNSVQQYIAGEEIQFVRPRSISSIILIALAVLFLFFLLFIIGVSFS